MRSAPLAACAVLTSLLSTPPAGAALPVQGGAGASAVFTQLTEFPAGTAVFEPTITADGRAIAFRTTGDLTGQNPEANFEVFLWTEDTGFTQLTQTPTGVGNFEPLIDPTGSDVVFRSAFDYTGGNPDGLFELFRIDVQSGSITQVTDNPAGVSVFDAERSGDGQFVVYRMIGDPLGLNPDGNFEIFRVELATGAIVQITQTTSANRENPTISGDGTRIAFAAREDNDGTNPNGNLEIQIWDEATLAITAVTQNPTDLYSNHPSIDDAGRYVAFLSLYDHTGGSAPGIKVHVADTTNGTVQLSTLTGTGEPFLDLAMSPDGSFCAFESDVDLLGANPDGGRELFSFSTGSATLLQLTTTPAGLSKNQLSDDARLRYLDVGLDRSFTYRSEQDLDPAVINVGGANLDLFRGRPSCRGEAFGEGGGPGSTPAGTELSLQQAEPFASAAVLRVTGADILSAGFVLISRGSAFSPAMPGLPPILIDLGLLTPNTLAFTSSGTGSANLPVDLAAGVMPQEIFLQAVTVYSPALPVVVFESSNGLLVTTCP